MKCGKQAPERTKIKEFGPCLVTSKKPSTNFINWGGGGGGMLTNGNH